jgi:hypothetical protein
MARLGTAASHEEQLNHSLRSASNGAAQSVEKSKPILTTKGDLKCAINSPHFIAVPGR